MIPHQALQKYQSFWKIKSVILSIRPENFIRQDKVRVEAEGNHERKMAREYGKI